MSEPSNEKAPVKLPVHAVARGLAAAGALLLSYGAHLAYAPAGFIVLGALLLVVGLGALR